ncbi:hypothetical protein EDB80DRAFT_729564, partial [Ilyonectria destructans]
MALELDAKAETIGSSPDRQVSKFVFQAASESEFYTTAICLGPGFGVQQLYPSHDSGHKLGAGLHSSSKCRIKTPEQLTKIMQGLRDGILTATFSAQLFEAQIHSTKSSAIYGSPAMRSKNQIGQKEML